MISYNNEGIGRLHEYIIPLEKIMKLEPFDDVHVIDFLFNSK